MRQLLGFGAFSSLINAASLLIFYTDALVIAAVLPVRWSRSIQLRVICASTRGSL